MTNIQRAERASRATSDSLTRLGQSKNLRRSDPLATAASSRRAFMAVLNTACTRHGARAGVSCWSLPGDTRAHHAVCGKRIDVVFSAGLR